MSGVKEAIVTGAHEESGIWDILTDIVDSESVDREEALTMLKDEISFIKERTDVYLIKSDNLYDSDTSVVIKKDELLGLTIEDVEFKVNGPYYYLSNVPGV
ncbi:hypothetical protein [Gallaecimonas pentaromativorans]|uniref:Uncharacterized protein n=1 Tax=Gallaecimonas pentaromativorans TaxID=584787 RepID=A0A3N1PLH0_9GAMM|nr:hypothetical protein [Gallaecimonas pentaromativorans]ROQ28718.1 hypothetical protein EDC28_103312 [Gallaecimonas pentaromativorans]